MANDITAAEALVEIEKGARLFRAFEKAEAVLRYMAGIEQNERELKDRVARLREETAQAEAGLTAAKDSAAKAISEGEKLAQSAIDDAQATAREIIETAESRASEMAARAKKVVESAEADVAAATKRVADLTAKIEQQANELADIENRLAEARAQRDRLLGA